MAVESGQPVVLNVADSATTCTLFSIIGVDAGLRIINVRTMKEALLYIANAEEFRRLRLLVTGGSINPRVVNLNEKIPSELPHPDGLRGGHLILYAARAQRISLGIPNPILVGYSYRSLRLNAEGADEVPPEYQPDPVKEGQPETDIVKGSLTITDLSDRLLLLLKTVCI